jgi:hypothetical protein
LSAFLVLLVIAPVAIRYWSKRHVPSWSWAFTGMAFGLIASPFSLGLYSTYFIGPLLGPVFLVTGLLGLGLTFLHGPPGYHFAVWLGLVKTFPVVDLGPTVTVEVMNGVIWGAVYGALGALLDVSLRRGGSRPNGRRKKVSRPSRV